MTDAVLVLARFLAFVAAAVLLGSALPFCGPRLSGRLGRASALGLLLASALLLGLQAGAMSGEGVLSLDPRVLGLVLARTAFGRACAVRMLIAAGLVLRFPSAARPRLALGAIAAGSLAFSGHGAADDGLLGLAHLAVDAAHLIAGAAWVGALTALCAVLLRRRRSSPNPPEALTAFAGLGGFLAAVLLLTGALNLVFMCTGAAGAVLGSSWARLLAWKLLAVFLMLVLAALNRWTLIPRWRASGRGEGFAVGLALGEAFVGLLVLALVAQLGVTPPSG